MFKCKVCGTLTKQYSPNCPRCGSSEIDQVPDADYSVPYEQYTPNAGYYPDNTGYTYAPAAKPRRGGIAQAIISLILGIEGFATAIGAMIYYFMLLSVPKTDTYNSYSSYHREVPNELFVVLSTFVISFVLVAVASAIVSLCLASAARNKGNESKLPALGRVFSFIAIGISAFSAILTIGAMM